MSFLIALAMTAITVAPMSEPRGAASLENRLRGGDVIAQRRSCKAVSSCREAVEMWCGGYSGADRDKDGIPCENVCRSKAQVDQIRAEIGC